MAQHPRLRPHFAAMLQNRRSAVPSCHAASSYYSATAMANESARRMRIDAYPQPNCRQRRSTAEFELDHRRSSSLVKCAIIFSKTKETAMYQPGPWCQQQHGTARKIPVLTFVQQISDKGRTNEKRSDDTKTVNTFTDSVHQAITMSSDCLGCGNTLSLSTSTNFVVERNGCDDLSPLRCMIDDPGGDISLMRKCKMN